MVNGGAAVEDNDFNLGAMVELFVADLEEIERLGERCGFYLPVGGYKESFDHGSSMIIFVDGCREDCESFFRSVSYISHAINKLICREVISQVSGTPVGHVLLRGSLYAVAVKLVVKRLSQGLERNLAIGYQLDVDLKVLDVDFDRIVGCVQEAYEREYMRYRLWTDESASKLGDFLFLGAGGYSAFDEPAFGVEYSRGKPLSMEGFIDAAEEAIFELPVVEGTGAAFPESPGGIIFSEYVPVGLMSREVLERLYARYLSWGFG